MTVADDVRSLEALSSAALRERWARLTGAPVPRISPALLRLALAWEMQARATGGPSCATTRTLDQLARGATRTTPTRPVCACCARGRARSTSSPPTRTAPSTGTGGRGAH